MIVVLVIFIGNSFLIYRASKATSSNMVNVNNDTNPNNNFNGSTPPDKPSNNGMDNSDSKNDSSPEMTSNEENGERKDMSMGGGNAPSMPGDNQGKSVKLTLDSNSTIKLMGDSYVTSLDNEVENNTNIDFNGYTLYVNGVAIS